jgi:hypothetical protein
MLDTVISECGLTKTEFQLTQDEVEIVTSFVDLDITKGNLLSDSENGEITILKDGVYQMSYGGILSLT